MRPVLKPTLGRRWRDAETLQLGTHPAAAVVITGLQSADRAVLELLDGTRTDAEIVLAAAGAGASAGQAGRLLDALRRAGALEDADAPDPLAELPFGDRARFRAELAQLSLRSDVPGAAAGAFRHRQQSTVLVHGAGRLGAPIAALLAAGGVGVVDVCDPTPTRAEDAIPGGLNSADTGRAREEAVAAAVPGVRIRRRTDTVLDAALVVLAPPPGMDVTTGERLRRDGVPHLAVNTVDGVGIVGPLVVPARSACLRCLDVHRRHRDPTGLYPDDRDGPDAAGSALAVATAALATIQALTFLDEPYTGVRPATLDGTLELRPPDWRLRRRSWPPHPDCGCAA
jgi:hypothetical protein